MVTLRRPRSLALLFALLSCADLALTAYLLRQGQGEVYEANWLAAEVLASYGLFGLAAFKALVVLLTAGLVVLLARSRPDRARQLAVFACLTVGAVVFYSVILCGQLTAQPTGAWHKESGLLERETRELLQAKRVRDDFMAQCSHWARALARGDCTVHEAASGLWNCPASQVYDHLSTHQDLMKARSREECLAGLVAAEALRMLHANNSSAARTRAESLLARCRDDYGPAVYAYLLNIIQCLPNIRPGEPSNGSRVVRLLAPTSPLRKVL